MDESRDFSEFQNQSSFGESKPKKSCSAEKVGPDFCSQCNGLGFFLRHGEASVEAHPCLCTDQLREVDEGWQITEKIREKISYIGSACIPNRYMKALNSKTIPPQVSGVEYTFFGRFQCRI